MTQADNDPPVKRPRLPPPGWMPDPSRIDIERYWDGTRWTARTRDRVSKKERIPAAEVNHAPRRERRTGRWMMALSLVALFAVVGAGFAGKLPSWVPGSGEFTLGTPHGPDVNYPVFGSDDTVQYLARSLIAQKQEIDLTYLQASGQDVEAVVQDAMDEAYTQNPYVFVKRWRVSIDVARVRLYPQYLYSADEAERRRQQTAAAVDAIVSSPAVQQAADARATVTALHDAVLTSSTYDFGAYLEIGDGATTESSERVARSQQAYGVLVEGTAVCTGYAHAFKLLAQAAGLEAVVVTGTASSGFTTGGHAWDQVLLDGQWLVVDPTWDDSNDDEIGRDFLLIDRYDPKLSTRTEDDKWMLDKNIGAYA